MIRAAISSSTVLALTAGISSIESIKHAITIFSIFTTFSLHSLILKNKIIHDDALGHTCVPYLA
jgi:hypothetical protein